MPSRSRNVSIARSMSRTAIAMRGMAVIMRSLLSLPVADHDAHVRITVQILLQVLANPCADRRHGRLVLGGKKLDRSFERAAKTPVPRLDLAQCGPSRGFSRLAKNRLQRSDDLWIL